MAWQTLNGDRKPNPKLKAGMIYTSGFYKDSLLVFIQGAGERSVDGWFFDLVSWRLKRDCLFDQKSTGKKITAGVFAIICGLVDLYEVQDHDAFYGQK